MKRIRRTSDQWQELFKTFEVSELRAVEFCSIHNINPKYFSKKKSEYSLKPRNTNGFVKVQINKSSGCTDLLLSIEYDDFRLNFYQLPDIEYLNGLIKPIS